jgi:hypothetical protein
VRRADRIKRGKTERYRQNAYPQKFCDGCMSEEACRVLDLLPLPVGTPDKKAGLHDAAANTAYE